MTLDIWLAYAVATTVLLTIPGPTVLLVVGYALSHGRRSGWATVPGVALGDATAVTASLAGLGAVLAASAEAFTALKLVGAAYLIWLGVRMWRTDPEGDGRLGGDGRKRPRDMFVHAYVVTALNPKGIAFFVAFLPQFVVAEAPVAPQLVILGATFVGLAIVNAAAYAVLAGGAGRLLHQRNLVRLADRVGGTLLIGAGVAMAALRRQ